MSMKKAFGNAWQLQLAKFKGPVTLDPIPYHGKFKTWLAGIAQPLNVSASQPDNWAAFASQSHYRVNGAVLSVGGDFKNFITVPEEHRITDPTELAKLFEERKASHRRTDVDNGAQNYAFYPSASEIKEGVSGWSLWFSWFWTPQVMEETSNTVTVKFVPGILAQVRHLFTLKPWTCTMHAQPG